VRVLPGEAVIEHKHVIGSTLPFPRQPGSGIQLRASSYRGFSGFLELLCNPEQLAPRLWAQAAQSEFLYAVRDSSHQQLAAEVRGRRSFVETTPLLTQFADLEGGEARERLRADGVSPGWLIEDDGAPDLWRAGASWIARLMGSPVRRCDRPGRAPLWPRQG
jgi:hypothetical protein